MFLIIIQSFIVETSCTGNPCGVGGCVVVESGYVCVCPAETEFNGTTCVGMVFTQAILIFDFQKQCEHP